ncbi:MAG: hypothetical protein HY723_06310, partial [Chloroflexi bacterium]|nr:hypothetical protein [Chloroflexota bacterium]
MRSLSSTLLAAQKAVSGVPYVEVKVSNRVANITRLRWASAYSASQPDDEHAAAADAGYLHRARVRAGTPQYERGAGAGWTSLNAQTDSAHIAVAAVNNQRVIVVYNRAAALYYRESTDQGASFAAETLLLSLGATPAALAVAYKNTSGDLVVVWAESNTLKRIRRTAGSFGSAATWTRSMNSLTGVAVQYAGDYNIVATGTDTSSRPVVASTVLGDGFFFAVDTWSALQYIAQAEAGSNVTFGVPSLAVLDTHRLVFVESYSGTVAYDRPQLTWFPPTQSFAANAWREPVPFDLNLSKGLAIAGNSATTYLSRPDAVWSASLASPATDLTEDVLEVELGLRRFAGQLRVMLRNDDGRYSNLSASAITPGAQLEVSPGYRTANGNERSLGLKFWIDRWEHTSEGGKATLALHASDAWALVEAWRAHREHYWPAGDEAISLILRFIFGRAAVELLSVGVSSPANANQPAFAIHPGEDGLRAAHRLLAMVPDTIVTAGELAYLSERQPAAASMYSYGTGHAIFRGRYGTRGLDANRVQVFGSPATAGLSEEFDWTEIRDRYDRLRQVFDLNLTSTAVADRRADDALRQEALALDLGELLIPVNCGQGL